MVNVAVVEQDGGTMSGCSVSGLTLGPSDESGEGGVTAMSTKESPTTHVISGGPARTSKAVEKAGENGKGGASKVRLWVARDPREPLLLAAFAYRFLTLLNLWVGCFCRVAPFIPAEGGA